jgi:hypothetical protein
VTQISAYRAQSPEAQERLGAALKEGFQTREAEMDLARMLGDLTVQ